MSTEVAFRDAARRIMARCDELARYSSMEGGIERVYLSPEHARVNRLASRWMREAGLDTWQDEAGNLNGHLAGRDPDAPSLLLGSHLDSVRDAGRYDGILGVLMAIEVVRHLGPRASSLRFGLDVVAFWDEEGARFGTALLGSSAMAGRWDPAWWDLTDENGTSLQDRLPGVRPGPRPDRCRRPRPREPGRLPRGAHRAGARPRPLEPAARRRDVDRERATVLGADPRRGPARGRHPLRGPARRPARRLGGHARRGTALPGRAPHRRHGRPAGDVPGSRQRGARRGAADGRPAR